MVKRLIIVAVGVVGLVVIGLGVASATAWRADDVLVAGTSGGAHTLVTEPGVLELGGDPVTVRITVPDKEQVTLAIGRDTDVAGWVGDEAYGQVTGLDGWHQLAVTGVKDSTPAPTATASDPAAAAPAPTPTATPDAAADDAVTAADPAGLRPLGRAGDGQGIGDARVAAAGGSLEPDRGQHRQVRAEPDARVAA